MGLVAGFVGDGVDAGLVAGFVGDVAGVGAEPPHAAKTINDTNKAVTMNSRSLLIFTTYIPPHFLF